MFVSTKMSSLVADMASQIAQSTENQIKAQLNDFISRGLIVVEYGPMSLVRGFEENTVDYRQTVTLRLKDREYIEKLEAELAKYKEIEAIISRPESEPEGD